MIGSDNCPNSKSACRGDNQIIDLSSRSAPATLGGAGLSFQPVGIVTLPADLLPDRQHVLNKSPFLVLLPSTNLRVLNSWSCWSSTLLDTQNALFFGRRNRSKIKQSGSLSPIFFGTPVLPVSNQMKAFTCILKLWSSSLSGNESNHTGW